MVEPHTCVDEARVEVGVFFTCCFLSLQNLRVSSSIWMIMWMKGADFHFPVLLANQGRSGIPSRAIVGGEDKSKQQQISSEILHDLSVQKVCPRLFRFRLKSYFRPQKNTMAEAFRLRETTMTYSTGNYIYEYRHSFGHFRNIISSES